MVKILMGGGKIQKLHQRAVQRRVLSRRTCRILRFRNLSGFGLGVTRHGRGSAAAALPPDLPALGAIEDVLEDLYGVRPLRVAMGATIPIGDIFRRVLGIETVFFSFSTADEDFHGPNEFFRLKGFRDGLRAWVRVLEAIGVHLGPATR